MTEHPGTDAGSGGLLGRFTLRWVAPPGWQQPPEGFVPDLSWRPDPYWPPAPDGWAFWRVDGPDDVVEQFHRPMSPQPEPPQPEWVAPPEWPAPPAGWHPTTGWAPERGWASPQPGWEFWRQAPEDGEAVASAALATRSDQLAQLNQVERLSREFDEQAAYAVGPQMQQVYDSLKTRTERRQVRESVEQAHAAAGEALQATRDSLLWLLRNDAPPNPAATGWLQVLFPRLDDALDWISRAKGLVPTEPADAARLRLLNSFPFGAVDTTTVQRGQYETIEVIVPEAVRKQAEELAVTAMRSFGFRDAHSSAADSGVDLRSAQAVAKVEYTSRQIGRPEIEALADAARGMASAFFSYSGFSSQAEAFAEERRIALFIVTLPQSVRPRNDRAAAMLRLG